MPSAPAALFLLALAASTVPVSPQAAEPEPGPARKPPTDTAPPAPGTSGVIRPPAQVDPGIAKPTPPASAFPTPVVPPPATGRTPVVPK
jgi:hypothetical protein